MTNDISTHFLNLRTTHSSRHPNGNIKFEVFVQKKTFNLHTTRSGRSLHIFKIHTCQLDEKSWGWSHSREPFTSTIITWISFVWRIKHSDRITLSYSGLFELWNSDIFSSEHKSKKLIGHIKTRSWNKVFKRKRRLPFTGLTLLRIKLCF